MDHIKTTAVINSPMMIQQFRKLFFEFSGPNEIANQSVSILSKKIGVSEEISKNLIKVSKSIIN